MLFVCVRTKPDTYQCLEAEKAARDCKMNCMAKTTRNQLKHAKLLQLKVYHGLKLNTALSFAWHLMSLSPIVLSPLTSIYNPSLYSTLFKSQLIIVNAKHSQYFMIPLTLHLNFH